jgi:hypothetical protein
MSYETTIRVPERPVGHKDVVFKVRKDGEILGRLKVSKGQSCGFPVRRAKGIG